MRVGVAVGPGSVVSGVVEDVGGADVGGTVGNGGGGVVGVVGVVGGGCCATGGAPTPGDPPPPPQPARTNSAASELEIKRNGKVVRRGVNGVLMRRL